VVLPDPGSPTRRYNIAGSFIAALWHIEELWWRVYPPGVCSASNSTAL
jgi:hypothetical protein